MRKEILSPSFLLLASILFLSFCFLQHPKDSLSLSHPLTLENLPLKHLLKDKSSEKLSPEFARLLKKSPPDKKFKVLADFDEQLDLAQYTRILMKHHLNKKQRREAVIEALRLISKKSEKGIKTFMDWLLTQEAIDYYQKLSIVNRIYLVANARAIFQLSERKDIARIYQEYSSLPRRSGRQRAKEFEILSQEEAFQENWAIKKMGVEEAWKKGFDGRGVIIGILDTGVWHHHEQLKENFRGDHNSWFDPVTGSTMPFDSKGHGTGVLSCAVGANKGGRIIGVAKGSKWIAALANYRNHYNNIYMSLAADWMLNIGRPDVIINAWSHSSKECYQFDLDFINAWKAAEMFPVFAAGNSGPSQGSSESPADLAGTWPDGSSVFSVGSIDSQGHISSFSSRGPSRCSHLIFPTIVAPGENVLFAFPAKSDAYIGYSGTSSATGYAAGMIAILIQKYPEMGVAEMEKLIKERALDMGKRGPDNDYGFGLIHWPSLVSD